MPAHRSATPLSKPSEQGGHMPSINLLIVDIDNTLFDWFFFWHSSFDAMISTVVERSNISRERLLDEARLVHQHNGTSEYAWLLQNLPSVAALPDSLRCSVIDSGRRAFRHARDKAEHLYDDVAETLRVVKGTGAKIAAFTESQSFYTIQRLLRFGLDGVLDVLYCTDEHDNPADLRSIRSKPDDAYHMKNTKVVVLPLKTKKPDPNILLTIVSDFHIAPDRSLYVGDSKMKDIFMAQQAGVHDAYAKYGQSMDREGYDLLRSVSHWTDEDIEREKTMAVDVAPTVSLEAGLSEILSHFRFAPSGSRELD
jgi:FMN phosphatase YigB (HAD superfamily)